MSMSAVLEHDSDTIPAEAEWVAPARRGAEHKYLIAVAVVLASLMQVIDSSIVNVALPDMMGNLGANLDEIAWVSTGYILASVIVIPSARSSFSRPRASSAAPRIRSGRSSSGASYRASVAARS